MKKKTFTLIASLLAICAILTTTVFAVTEHGWFRSDTGTGLNLVLDWDVVRPAGGETVEVSVAVALQHYALHVGARTVTLAIGGETQAADTPAIHTDDNSALQTTTLIGDTAAIPRKAGETVEVPIRASWVFNGVYAGKEIAALTVEKTLVITDDAVTIRDGVAGDAIVTTAAPVEPTQPAEPEQPDPIGGPAYSQQWSFRSDNGTWLNLICEVQAADSIGNEGMYDVTYSLTLEYYSLWMSPKTGSITVGGKKTTFTAPAIAEESNTLHRLTLTTRSFTAAPGQAFDLSAEMPFGGTYSGKPLEKIVVAGNVVLD
ncbi:MAG: hypothetical protein IJX53_06725 [Clostridia bacterium]|nr:hypothetical protein [Clostridia bacterium]